MTLIPVLPHRGLVAVAAALLMAAWAGFAADPPPASQAAETQPAGQKELDKLVGDYLKAENRGDRARTARKISRLEGVGVDEVADALRRVNIWKSAKSGLAKQSIDFEGRQYTAWVNVPPKYDSAKAYPLIVGLPNEGTSGEQFAEVVVSMIGDRASRFLVAVFEDYEGVWFGSPESAASWPRDVLVGLKHAYHVDSDRVFLLGYGRGGDAALVTAALYADQFTGVVSLAGTMAVRIADEAAIVLLGNLRDLPVLLVYGAEDLRVAPANQCIKSIAAEHDLPIHIIEIADAGESGVSPPAAALHDLLDKRRPPVPRRVDHWFRYLPQADSTWLRPTLLQGEPWSAEYLTVRPGPDESPREATRAVLEQALPHIGGHVEDQTVRVETRRIDKLAVLLNDDLIDLDRDLVIDLDGTKRFEGRARRSIDTMLETAAADWDFQRLWSVRFELGEKGRAVQD